MFFQYRGNENFQIISFETAMAYIRKGTRSILNCRIAAEDLNRLDPASGETLLTCALSLGSIRIKKEIVQFLVDMEGIDLSRRNRDGQTALHKIADCADNLHSDKSAAAFLNILLLNPNIDVNLTDRLGRTAFQYYVKSGLISCVETLFSLRPDVDTSTDNFIISEGFSLNALDICRHSSSAKYRKISAMIDDYNQLSAIDSRFKFID